MKQIDFSKYQNIGFEDFRRMAGESSLSPYEKIGFPNSYRVGFEEKIFEDICSKLSLLTQKNKNILDIGPGCSELPQMLIDLCRQNGHTLFLIDSAEMLGKLPDEPFIEKIPARYPEEARSFIEKHAQKIDVVLTYSVFHYIFTEGNIFDFVDQSLGLLADGGQILIGDIPNTSKRKRFFKSANGIAFHQRFTGMLEIPDVTFNQIEGGAIDDGVLMGLLVRCRAFGFDAYLLPQSQNLPMANRREDLLILKP